MAANDPFGAPASSTGIDWKDLKGSLLLFKVHGYEAAIPTVHGESPAVRADVIVLDGDKADEEYRDTLVFPKVLVSQIRSQVGGMVLGRLGQGVKKAGQSPPWTLAEATEDEKVIGRDYLAKTTDAPF